MSALAAYTLVPLVYFLVLREKSLKACKIESIAALTVHQFAILSNLYFTRLPGYAADSRRFYETALKGINWGELVGTGKSFYCNFLAGIFSIAGPSQDLALQSSFLGFGLVLIAAGRLSVALGHQEKTGIAILLIGLSPSGLCYTSSILREVWQQLFLVTSSLFAIKLRSRFSPRNLTGLIASLVFLGCLQKGLALYALLFGSFAFLFCTQKGNNRGPIIATILTVLFVGGYINLLINSQLEVETSSQVVDAFTEGEILEYAVEYRGGLNEARANYADHLELNTGTGLVFATPQLLLYYWFCPLPWQVGEAIDLVALAEILIRTVMVAVGLTGLQRADRETRARLMFLWLLFFILEFMFAVGTGNWGTAARHRTVGLPLFSVISVAGLVKNRKKGEDVSEGQSPEPRRLSKREQIRRRRRRLRQESETARSR